MEDNVLLLQTSDGVGSLIYWQTELMREGFKVQCCDSIEAAAEEAAKDLPDVFIIFVEDKAGNIYEKMDQIWGELFFPVIVILNNWDTKEAVFALSCGMNDVVSYQIPVEELAARVRGLIKLFRRLVDGYAAELVYEDLKMELKGRKAYRGEELIRLTPKEFELLRYMVKRAGQVCHRDAILQEVWGYDFSTGTNVVDVYIRHLRKKIDKGKSRKLIHTVRGTGYTVH